MLIADAQREMRHAYFGGAPGMMVSALAWLVAGIVALQMSPQRAVWALFIGGMCIHPVSLLLVKALGRPARHSPENPFGPLAFATTVWMILSLPLAYAASLLHIEWFFPAMLFVIGGRYTTFATIYGERLYWICGIALVLAGYALGYSLARPALGAFSGAAIEAAFALVLFASARREAASAPA